MRVLLRRACFAASALALAGSLWLPAGPAAAADCPAAGSWLDPSTGKLLAPEDVVADLAARDVVLLGETHNSAEQHLWQATMLAALHGRRPQVVVGFEAFPRRVQPVLDRWVAGALTEQDFLKQSDWQRVWGYDADLYLPLFNIARQQRLPMIALNVERALIARVGDEGWAAVPAEAREGVTDPAPAGEDYRRALAEVFSGQHGETAPGEPDGDESALEEVMAGEDFGRFVAAQLTWDRAMAEGLAEAHRAHPDSLVVGIVGRGHAEYGHGIPHQLADLGVESVGVAFPVPVGSLCGETDPGLADAVFLVDPDPDSGTESVAAPPGPRLGVMIGPAGPAEARAGVAISEVIAGSVAEAAGLAEGDVVTEAAGVDVKAPDELIAVVKRQAPGTWLPLRIERDGESLEIVARFPARFGEIE